MKVWPGRVATLADIADELTRLHGLAGFEGRREHHVSPTLVTRVPRFVVVQMSAEDSPAVVTVDPKALSFHAQSAFEGSDDGRPFRRLDIDAGVAIPAP